MLIFLLSLALAAVEVCGLSFFLPEMSGAWLTFGFWFLAWANTTIIALVFGLYNKFAN